jgi:hypothetical protein
MLKPENFRGGKKAFNMIFRKIEESVTDLEDLITPVSVQQIGIVQ